MTVERSIKDHPAYKQILLNADVKDMENSKQSFLDCTEFEANDYYESLKEFVDNPIKKSEDVTYVSFSKALGEALTNNSWEDFSNLLGPDVSLVLYDTKEINGKAEVINYWKDWKVRYNEPFAGTKYSVKFCAFFNRSALLINNRRSRMYVIAHYEGNLVKTILFIAHTFHGSLVRYWDLDHQMLSYDNTIDLYVSTGKDLDPISNRCPCMRCGCKSENLIWTNYNLNRQVLSYNGELSYCPNCMAFVEYRPSAMSVSRG